MREIIFRGKDHFTGEWRYGYLMKNSLGDSFFDSITVFCGHECSRHRITSETIGQYTGLTDKDGVKIFEGDIVKLSYGIPPTFDKLSIEWRNSGWFLQNCNPERISSFLQRCFMGDITVIGTIHDKEQPCLDCDHNVNCSEDTGE